MPLRMDQAEGHKAHNHPTRKGKSLEEPMQVQSIHLCDSDDDHTLEQELAKVPPERQMEDIVKTQQEQLCKKKSI